MQEKSAAGKNEIKEKFNQMACQINIDAHQLICALLGEEVPKELTAYAEDEK